MNQVKNIQIGYFYIKYQKKYIDWVFLYKIYPKIKNKNFVLNKKYQKKKYRLGIFI